MRLQPITTTASEATVRQSVAGGRQVSKAALYSNAMKHVTSWLARFPLRSRIHHRSRTRHSGRRYLPLLCISPKHLVFEQWHREATTLFRPQYMAWFEAAANRILCSAETPHFAVYWRTRPDPFLGVSNAPWIADIIKLPHYVTHCGSPVPVAPSCCHPDRRSWRSWHSLRARGRARARNLRPRLQWASCAGSH